MREWLTENFESRRHRRVAPAGFRDKQIDEGIRIEGVGHGTHDARYADLVVFSGEDRTEALMAVEYVEDLAKSC